MPDKPRKDMSEQALHGGIASSRIMLIMLTSPDLGFLHILYSEIKSAVQLISCDRSHKVDRDIWLLSARVSCELSDTFAAPSLTVSELLKSCLPSPIQSYLWVTFKPLGHLMFSLRPCRAP